MAAMMAGICSLVPDVYKRQGQHIAQRAIHVGHDDGNVTRGHAPAIDQFVEHGAEVGDHLAPVAPADDGQDALGRALGRQCSVQQVVFDLVRQRGHVGRGDEAVAEVEDVGEAPAHALRAVGVGGQEALIAAAGIDGHGRGLRLAHQPGDEVLPGRGLLLQIIDDEVAVALAEVAVEFGVAHQLGIEKLNRQRQVEQAIGQAAAAEGAGGRGRVVQVEATLRLARPGARLSLIHI